MCVYSDAHGFQQILKVTKQPTKQTKKPKASKTPLDRGENQCLENQGLSSNCTNF